MTASGSILLAIGNNPALNSREIMNRLIKALPEQFPNDSAMRTLQRRLKERREK